MTSTYYIPSTAIGSVPSRVYRATQLHTDGVEYRESAGTGPEVVLKVVLVTGAAAFSGDTMDHFLSASLFFPHPLQHVSYIRDTEGVKQR